MLNVAVLVSGGGTNLQALINAKQNNELKHCNLSLVISNKKNAYALTRAEENNIKTAVVVKKKDMTSFEYGELLITVLKENNIDLIVLAGFLVILDKNVITTYKDKIINIHPSLIPSFSGDGYYGLKVHEEVLKRGVKVTGATVHLVNEITDGGKILAQKAVNVLPGDDAVTLQERVMREAEWVLLSQEVEKLAKKECENKC